MQNREYTPFYKIHNCIIIYNKYIINYLFFTDLSQLIVWNEVKEFKLLYNFSFKPIKEYRHKT